MKKIILFLILLQTALIAIGQPTCRTRTNSAQLSYQNVSGITITALNITPASDTTAGITLKNCHDIIIVDNNINGGVRTINDAAEVRRLGIYLYNCYNIIIYNNHIENAATGVYAINCTRKIQIHHNEFKNMTGPFPRGQYVQLNNCSGDSTLISYNHMENIALQSYPEDGINLYQCHGTSSSSMMIQGNWMRGGGPSTTGGGILLGDNSLAPYVPGDAYQIAQDNILVDPGHYGIGVVGGQHMQLINNKVYGRQQPFTAVGIQIYNYYLSAGAACLSVTASGNQVNWKNSAGENNPYFAPGSCGTLTGWSTNNFAATINTSILPTSLFVACTTVSSATAYIRGDTVKVSNKGKNAVIILENHTKDSTGFAANIGGGRLEYRHVGISDVTSLRDSIAKKLNRTDLITTNFINGLTKVSGTVKLGGHIGEDTNLEVDSARTIIIGHYVNGYGVGISNLNSNGFVSQMGGGNANFSNNSFFSAGQDGSSDISSYNGSVHKSLHIDPTPGTGRVTFTDTELKGIENAADYSAYEITHDNALLSKKAGDLLYAHFGSGVTLFNGRAGGVNLTSGDVASALGFSPENIANKATSFNTINNTLYPTTQAVQNYVTSRAYTPDTTVLALLQRTVVNQTSNTITIHNYTTGSETFLRSKQDVPPGTIGTSTRFSTNNSTEVWNDTGNSYYVDFYTSTDNGATFSLLQSHVHILANSIVGGGPFILLTDYGVAPVLPLIYKSATGTPTIPVTSVFGRTGAVVAASNDYTFSQIGSKPTTLLGYGITDNIAIYKTVATYALMVADGIPTILTIYKVTADENKSQSYTEYHWWPDGKRLWVAATTDN